MADESQKDWKSLAQLAATEQDPKKLLDIVTELNNVLREREDRMADSAPGRHLLLVDDDPNIRLTLLPVLQQHGFEVQLAATAAEAITAIGQNKFNALVSDLNITESNDGFTVVAAMRQAFPRSVIILLTGFPAFESALEGIHQEVDDYIVKPADYDLLIRSLEAKLDTRKRF